MATYYVSKSGSDVNGGTSYADSWLTIQHAADTIASGDTIYVGSGVYNENVVFDHKNDYTLIGDGYVVIDGGGSGNGIYNIYSGTQITEIEIRNCGIAYKTVGSTTTISNCIIHNCSTGLWSYHYGGVQTYENCLLYDNTYDVKSGWGTAHFIINRCTLVSSIGLQGYTANTSNPDGARWDITNTVITGKLDIDILDLNEGFDVSQMDFNCLSGDIYYKGVLHTLAEFQSQYSSNAHSFDANPVLNTDRTLNWSSSCIGTGEAGVDIGAYSAATYYTGTGDLFDGATLTNVSRDENGDFKLDNGATTGTIVSAVLDFGADITLGNIRWLSTETYPLDVIDSDNTDSAPNRREIEYRSQTDAQGSFAQGDAEPPNWTDIERNDDLSLSCRYFQVKITLRDNGVEA